MGPEKSHRPRNVANENSLRKCGRGLIKFSITKNGSGERASVCPVSLRTRTRSAVAVVNLNSKVRGKQIMNPSVRMTEHAPSVHRSNLGQNSRDLIDIILGLILVRIISFAKGLICHRTWVHMC